MYGIKLTFHILDIISKNAAPLTVSELCTQLAPKIADYQKNSLRARVLRRLHGLEQLGRLKLEYHQTEIKTQYLKIIAL